MLVREVCPACGSQPFKTNGPIHHGKHNHHCKACGRQCVLLATQRLVPTEDRALFERLLCEKISLHELHRVPPLTPYQELLNSLEPRSGQTWGMLAGVSPPAPDQNRSSGRPLAVEG